MKRPEKEITLFSPTTREMRNKNSNVKRTNKNIMNIFELNSIMHRSSQQTYPNITDKLNNAIYERTGNTKKTYLRRLSSHTSPAPEKSTYMLINGRTRH